MSGQFDTSGVVYGQSPQWGGTCVFWSQISPFVQGYVEAMARSLGEFIPQWDAVEERTELREVRFSDLAPETLARIMEDCARFLESYPTTDKGAAGGARFCIARRCAEATSAFPPLTVYLGDDGKVRLKAAPLPQGDE